MLLLTFFLLCSCAEKDEVITSEDLSLDFSPSVVIDSNAPLTTDSPEYYNHIVGGQKALWTNLNYQTNGEHIRIEITGEWTSWYGSEAKRYVDKSNICNMEIVGNEPMEIYSISSDVQNAITGQALHHDRQEACWYTGGSGLYLGLFGSSGTVLPEIFFHLETMDRECRSPFKEFDGDCILINEDKSIESNKWTYIYSTVGDPIWGGTPEPNQYVKLVILDNFYRDNSGKYRVKFLSGVKVVRPDSSGIISSLIEIIEKISFGSGDQKGIVEILYKQLISDSVFGNLVRLVLILFVTMLGFGIITGTTKLTQKEILNRVIKIGVVLLFTGNNAWEFFNNFVIKWFIYGTNSIIMFLLSVMETIFGTRFQNLEIVTTSSSMAGNFSFTEEIWQILFSSTIQNKLWGLLFSEALGFVAIALVYISILFFIIVLVYFAQIYIFFILQMAVALAFAPIFACFMLFKKTKHVFFGWLSFIVGRTSEIILMFFSVYLFTSMIKNMYLDIFSYGVQGRNLFQDAEWMEDVGLNLVVYKTIEDVSALDISLKTLIITGLVFLIFVMIGISSRFGSMVASSFGGAKDPGGAGLTGMSGMAFSSIMEIYKNAVKPAASLINKIPQVEVLGKNIFGEDKKTLAGLARRGLITKPGVAVKKGASFVAGRWTSPKTKRTMKERNADDTIGMLEKQALKKGYSGNELKSEMKKQAISLINKENLSSYHFGKGAERKFVLGRIDHYFDRKKVMSAKDSSIDSINKKLKETRNSREDKMGLSRSEIFRNMKELVGDYKEKKQLYTEKADNEEMLRDYVERMTLREVATKQKMDYNQLVDSMSERGYADVHEEVLNSTLEKLDINNKEREAIEEEYERARDLATKNRFEEYKDIYSDDSEINNRLREEKQEAESASKEDEEEDIIIGAEKQIDEAEKVRLEEAKRKAEQEKVEEQERLQNLQKQEVIEEYKDEVQKEPTEDEVEEKSRKEKIKKDQINKLRKVELGKLESQRLALKDRIKKMSKDKNKNKVVFDNLQNDLKNLDRKIEELRK